MRSTLGRLSGGKPWVLRLGLTVLLMCECFVPFFRIIPPCDPTADDRLYHICITAISVSPLACWLTLHHFTLSCHLLSFIHWVMMMSHLPVRHKACVLHLDIVFFFLWMSKSALSNFLLYGSNCMFSIPSVWQTISKSRERVWMKFGGTAPRTRSRRALNQEHLDLVVDSWNINNNQELPTTHWG